MHISLQRSDGKERDRRRRGKGRRRLPGAEGTPILGYEATVPPQPRADFIREHTLNTKSEGTRFRSILPPGACPPCKHCLTKLKRGLCVLIRSRCGRQSTAEAFLPQTRSTFSRFQKGPSRRQSILSVLSPEGLVYIKRYCSNHLELVLPALITKGANPHPVDMNKR